MSNTRIVVVKLKEILLTVALVLTGLVAVLLVILLISSDNDTGSVSDAAASAFYHPGVYTSSAVLNDTTVQLELVCDSTRIRSVRLVNPDEAVETMYPLLGPALSDLEMQLAKEVSVENLVLSEHSKYTQTLLIEIIEQTLDKARVRN